MKKRATWMVAGCCLVMVAAAGGVLGEEPVSVSKDSVVAEKEEAPLAGGPQAKKDHEPWLGIDVTKPDPAVHAQLKNIPSGVGFVVSGVSAGSPAELAGLKEYDFVWKMDDQLLINRCQFWTLLNLRKEGEQVSLTVQRGGENQEVELKVGRRPEDQRGRDRADVRVMSPAIPGLPTQYHDLLRKVAELSDDEGAVRIWRKAEGFAWAQFDEFDLEIGSGELSGGEDEAFPPKMDPTLKAKLQALIRGYEQADRHRRSSGRSPRARRVPAPGSSR